MPLLHRIMIIVFTGAMVEQHAPFLDIFLLIEICAYASGVVTGCFEASRARSFFWWGALEWVSRFESLVPSATWSVVVPPLLLYAFAVSDIRHGSGLRILFPISCDACGAGMLASGLLCRRRVPRAVGGGFFMLFSFAFLSLNQYECCTRHCCPLANR